MSTLELKSNLHELIDGIENEDLLQSIFEILEAQKDSTTGNLWNSLSLRQQQEVLSAYEESESEENLIPHSEMLKKLK